MATYRVRVTWTYSNTSAATTAQGNINTYLSGAGRSETCERTGSTIDLLIEGLTEAEATTVGNGLTAQWASGTRTAGKASIVRRP